MDIEKLKILARLGLIEVFQSHLEGDEEFDSYYYRENEEIEDEFFKENLENEDL